jgi:hypothetical protein
MILHVSACLSPTLHDTSNSVKSIKSRKTTTTTTTTKQNVDPAVQILIFDPNFLRQIAQRPAAQQAL